MTPEQREAEVTLPVYARMPLDPRSGDGCEIITADGQRILDLYGGHAVAGLGYGHPALTNAIAQQADQLIFQSNAVAMSVRASAAEKLVAVAPDGLTHTLFVNSGAEANENALRIACAQTGRQKVVAVMHGFHGRTAAAAAVSWRADHWYGFPNKPFDVEFVMRDDIDDIDDKVDDSTAAIIFEPIQGLAGAYDLAPNFVRALADAARRHGAMLIADEVQCGSARSGMFFASEWYGIAPDMATVAKAIGGGVPCGALLTTSTIASDVAIGQLGTTFGGGPLAMAAIGAVIDTIRKENLLQNVRDREAQIRIDCVAGPVRAVQGKGLLLGLVCDIPAATVQQALLERGILTGTSTDANVLRLLPPLTLQSEHIDQLQRALKKFSMKATA